MSFFRKLLGGSFADHFAEGNRLFDAGSFGSAKLRFEKALSRAKGEAPDTIARAEERLSQCKRSLADGKIEAADQAAHAGALQDALRLLHDADEICDDPAVVDAVQERLRSYEAMEVRSLVEEVDQIDDDELLTIIAGTWSDARAAEYASMPEELRVGLLADHDGRHDEAVDIYKGIISRPNLAVPPRFLFLETAKALLSCERFAEALEMTESYFKTGGDGDDSLDGTLAAFEMKAAALTAMDRFDEAEEAFRSAARAAPSNHTAFLKLGVFLRGQNKLEQSLRMLERSQALMGQMQPDFAVIRELGFTYLAMGKKKEAADCFGGVIEHLAARGEHSEFDPIATPALASIYEERNEFQKAADLFRHLSVGHDTAKYFVYNIEAARLLRLAGAEAALVDKYLDRARELAETDAETAMLEAIAAD